MITRLEIGLDRVESEYISFPGPTRVEAKYAPFGREPGRYGHLVLEVTPISNSNKIVLEWPMPAAFIPEEVNQEEYMRAIGKGIEEAAAKGNEYGKPVKGMKITITNGSFHPVDSNPLSFRIAAEQALRNAFVAVGIVPYNAGCGPTKR